jgi:hydroxyethylthiazole kinase-like uncharacterized protein yjeF
MQNLFNEVGSLDQRCYEEYALTEDILMEHASNGMANYIKKTFPNKSKIIIVCGSGNNGADGIALSRLLHVEYDVKLLFAKPPKSHMAQLQDKRRLKIGVKDINNLEQSDVIVDAIVGTGFNGNFDSNILNIINQMNQSNAYKIACDVPSGYKFFADITLTMGGLKKDMFLDSHKEYVGDINVLDLGISRKIYEKESNWKLLDEDDIKLPFRDKKDTHKGTFGHLAVACGEKSGATILSASAATKFGVGLVTIVGFKNIQIPHHLMFSKTLPKTTNTLALGMGLGDGFSNNELHTFLDNDYPLIADADILHMSYIKKILQRKDVVITPHPKEFVSLLKQIDLAHINIDELQKNRFDYVELFCRNYPNITLVLKGANTIIGQKDKFFVNPHGTSKLSKGGSGDILSGLIGSLLAQNYSPLEAAINGSLTLTKLAKLYTGADFSLTPDDLIEQICNL